MKRLEWSGEIRYGNRVYFDNGKQPKRRTGAEIMFRHD
jgi:hypothetical protein